MKTTSDRSGRLLRIHGLVQGVGYRNALLAEARRLGLDGWVRNRTDGTVEALAEGPTAAVNTLIEWARCGPPAARVSGVDAIPADSSAEPGFRRLPTA